MAREAENIIPEGTSLAKVKKAVDLLGFFPVRDWRDVEHQIGSYMWHELDDYKSWTGVELSIFLRDGALIVYTRSRYGGSYWDIAKHNETLKVLKDFLGGHFESDYGRNRYFPNDEAKATATASGCYLARWKFQNAITKASLYHSSRGLDAEFALDEPHPIPFLDEMNPRLLSNNMMLPYLIGVWEHYFRQLFVVTLRASGVSDRVLANVSTSRLKSSLMSGSEAEEIVASQFSFQRPSVIIRNFKLIDKSLDFEECWTRTKSGKPKRLAAQIEDLVADRNAFVHSGKMNMNFYDKNAKSAISRLIQAANKSHEKLGSFYNFEPITYY